MERTSAAGILPGLVLSRLVGLLSSSVLVPRTQPMMVAMLGGDPGQCCRSLARDLRRTGSSVGARASSRPSRQWTALEGRLLRLSGTR